jgi:uncharacterized protein YkwD
MRSSVAESGKTAEHTTASGASRRAPLAVRPAAGAGRLSRCTTERHAISTACRNVDPIGRNHATLADMRGRDAPCIALTAALVVLAAIPAAAGAATCAHRDDPASSLSLQDRRAALLCVVDAERAARGLPVVHENTQLSRAAQKHAADMVARQFFSHVTPGGATLGDRVRATGYLRGRRDWGLGEALAWAQVPLDSPASLVRSWLDSPPHRAILLDRRYRDVGIGVVPGLTQESTLPGATAVLDFGFRSSSSTVARWRSATACARTARRSRQPRDRCASTSRRSMRSLRATHPSSTRSATT